MPLLNHKNVVRYYSCWVEAVETCPKFLKKVVNGLSYNHHFKSGQRTKVDSSELDEIQEETLIDTTLLD